VGRLLALVLTGLALVWLAILIGAPAGLSSGRPGAALSAAVAYQAAGRVCHQRPERSFRVGGIQQPVCARCFGLYASGALGALLGWMAGRGTRADRRERWVLAACGAPTAVTWSLEFARLAAFSNTTRAMAALPLGLAAGYIFVKGLRSSAIS
jgi:uncharacterized membrane protein